MLTAGDDTPHRPEPSRTPQTPAGSQTPASSQAPDTLQADPVQVRAGSPESLLAIVPGLLGFVPQASLVVIGTEAPHDRIKVTLRYDLPDPPGAGVSADIAALDAAAAKVLAIMIPIGSNNVATRQRPRPSTALPLRISLPPIEYRDCAFPSEWDLLTKTCELNPRRTQHNGTF